MSLVLRDRRTLLSTILDERDAVSNFGRLVVRIVVAGAIYGAVLGMWRGPQLALYVAIKLPLLLFGTSLLTAILNWFIAILGGLHLRFTQSVMVALAALAAAAVVLASLAPVAWLFTISLPPPSLSARTVHNILFLAHTAIVAAAGLAGSASLRALLLNVAEGGPRAARDAAIVARRVYVAWIVAFALVGGEVAWILRPFVGSIYSPIEFVRDEALQGNVYEFIVTDILPHLIRANGG